MVGLLIHAVVYVVACGSLVAGWTLVQGSTAGLEAVISDPTQWKAVGFWPIWVVLGWGAALLLHAGIVFAALLFGGKRRRRKRRLREARTEAKIRRAGEAAPPAPADAGNDGSGPSRQWVTVMFVDIAGSTTLNEELGDEEWSRFLVEFRDLVRRDVVSRNGREVGTQGDGLLASFPSPADAVLCAVDVQRDIGTKLVDPHPITVRIGVNAGQAVHDDGDLIGRVINVASRVTGEAAPGEILVTEPVAEYVGSRLRLEDRGLHELKGIAQPRHLLAVDWVGAGDGAVPSSP
ncbi:MAG: 2TM domain-containing protein [Acidimicrobiia bacterium]|nr:2TM domain-containing protein [Acidimicrobiia bacterium]